MREPADGGMPAGTGEPEAENPAENKKPGEDGKPTGPGLYVYAIVPSTLSPDDLGAGINAAQLKLVAVAEGLAAVVHQHEAEPFDGADADVERWILEHGGVVERCWEAAGTVLPMSFNVIVAAGDGSTAEQRLAGWLGESARELTERLKALQERVELRIEISLDQHATAEASSEAADLREEMRQRPAGVQRLLQKRLDKTERDIAERLADGLYPEYRRRLAALSEDLTENRRAHRPPGTVSVLSVAVLAHRDDVEKIGLELTSIGDEQPAAQIRFLGPWPPYSFAEVPELGAG
ncbi:GvpL/GvpF family gas vesicle protein [Arthrobacter monumenti]